MRLMIAVAALACLPGPEAGVQEEKKVRVDDFESDLSGWAALKLHEGAGPDADSESKVAVTREAADVKAGKGALSYAYEIKPKTVRLLALQRELDLSGMQSLRFWVKCSDATAVVFTLTEKGGASYQAAAYCGAGAWQEVAVNLDEFTADDPAKDPNGKLDADQVGSLNVFDIAGFLSLFLGDLKGSRKLWLDDIVFSSKRLALTTGPTSVTKVTPIHLVDNFESPVIRWSPISVEFGDAPKFSLFGAPAAVDTIAPAGGGKQSLKFSYPRKTAKVHGLMRSVEKVDLGKAAGLDLHVRVSHDGTYIVNLEEKDGSRYNKMVELKMEDGWKLLSYGLGDFTVADDSQDENGKLDPGQIKQIIVADITPLVGGAESDAVRLWIDEVQFILSR